MLIGIIGWVVLGLIVGFVASKVIDLKGDDPRLGIAVGAMGGLIGGWLYAVISGSPISKFDGMSMVFAAIGAAVLAGAWYVVRRRAAPVAYLNRRYR
jgi:uncharacterized membrane protein YeaQ/YmgE (transglycosylase-associated protein family)